MKKLILILAATGFFAQVYGAPVLPGAFGQPGQAASMPSQPNQVTSTPSQVSTSTIPSQAASISATPGQTTSAPSQASQPAQISPEDEAKMDSETLYNSLTTSADYSYRPQYQSVTHTPRDLFQDIKVSAVESVPFALAYSFLGIAIYESIKQQQ